MWNSCLILLSEQAITTAANTRVKDLRNELVAEKNKYVLLEKKLKESVDQHQSDLHALQQRMQHAHEQHLLETSNLQSRIKALEQGSDKAALQKLTDVSVTFGHFIILSFVVVENLVQCYIMCYIFCCSS